MTCLRTAATALVVAALLAGACGGTSEPQSADPVQADRPTTSTSVTATTPVASESAADDVTPDPLNVELTAEPGSAVSATVDRDGGSVEAISATGIRYTLTIPAGALIGETEITMRPLASVSGGPLDGVEAGVDLEPAGLVFFEPATLTISGADLTDGAAGFSTDDDGHDFHLTPSVVDQDSVTITTTHFSAYGYVGWGNVEELAKHYTPSGAEAIALQTLTFIDMQWQEMTPQQLYDAESLVFDAWATAVLDHLYAAQDDASLDHATVEMLSFIVRLELRLETRQSQGIDISQSPLLGTAQAMIDAWFQMAQMSVDRYIDQCESGDPAGAFGILRWLSIGSYLQEKFTLDRPVLDTWKSEMEKCFQFRVEWETTVVFITSDGTATTKTLATAEIHPGKFLIDELFSSADAPEIPYPRGTIDVTSFKMPTVRGKTCTPVVGAGRWVVGPDIRIAHLNLSDIRAWDITSLAINFNVLEPPSISCEEFEGLAPGQHPRLVEAFWMFPIETVNKTSRGDDRYVQYTLDIVEQPELYATQTYDETVDVNGGEAKVTEIIRVIHR